MFLFTVFLLSCSNSESEESNDVSVDSISAKWSINSDTYESVEFNEDGQYILVKTISGSARTVNDVDPIILFGDYTINDEIITLENFGDIVV